MQSKFPIEIDFECHDTKGLTPDARQWINRLKEEVKIKLLAENGIGIKYPPDIVKEIRTVNVDDMIYRLDFIDPGNRFNMCNCVFPKVPWNNKEFMTKRWPHGKRYGREGCLIIRYPEAAGTNEQPDRTTLEKLVNLRSRAFDMANSGKYGEYPFDETFNDEVEKGFKDDGTSWTAKDRTTITI